MQHKCGNLVFGTRYKSLSGFHDNLDSTCNILKLSSFMPWVTNASSRVCARKNPEFTPKCIIVNSTIKQQNFLKIVEYSTFSFIRYF
jgi:hypothetical protein